MMQFDRTNENGWARPLSKKGCSPDNTACEGLVMKEYTNERNDIVRKRYEEAFSYLNGGDILLLNPQKAFLIFEELADEGFVWASFCCGLMLCMGIGTKKNTEKGKDILKSQEKLLGYTTEIVMEKHGLFKELTLEEKLKCINYWKNNSEIRHVF